MLSICFFYRQTGVGNFIFHFLSFPSWCNGGNRIQGAIALVDNLEADGGTVVVPKFAAHFNEWRKHLGSWASNRVGQRRRGLAYQFSDPRDPIHGLARRVPIRKGSLVVWNQTTVHGKDDKS
jgi:ectoine hydroxylase-related dioxygenase (phytanoyl-CoA dioxygenase family)